MTDPPSRKGRCVANGTQWILFCYDPKLDLKCTERNLQEVAPGVRRGHGQQAAADGWRWLPPGLRARWGL